MKGSGNGLLTILQKLFFYALPTCKMRTSYIEQHSYMFRHIGKNLKWQPRQFPADPELISIGDNVKLASNVQFINHDIVSEMLNDKFQTKEFQKNQGCIRIGNNVMIGSGVKILPNVCISDNCVVGGGAIVTKDIPEGSVAAGVPCRVIGSIDKLIEKSKRVVYYESAEAYWREFEEIRQRKSMTMTI